MKVLPKEEVQAPKGRSNEVAPKEEVQAEPEQKK